MAETDWNHAIRTVLRQTARTIVMDQKTRQLIEDEDDEQPRSEKRSSKPAKSAVKQDRRQQEKAWGRSIDKFLKERDRFQKQHGRKPE
jgi:hypothetical protein